MRNVFEGGAYIVQVFHDPTTNDVVVRTDDNPDITLSPNEVIDLYNKLGPIYNTIKNGN